MEKGLKALPSGLQEGRVDSSEAGGEEGGGGQEEGKREVLEDKTGAGVIVLERYRRKDKNRMDE